MEAPSRAKEESLPPAPQQEQKQRQSAGKRGLILVVLAALLLLQYLAWWVLLGICTAQHLWTEYLQKNIAATARANDVDDTVRWEDSTYYSRPCSTQDLTLRAAGGDKASRALLLTSDNGRSPEDYADQIMTHGVGVIPNLLRNDTVSALHRYLSLRNDNLSEEDSQYIDSWDFRKVFRVDLGEDLSVQLALEEITSNPVLKATLFGLLGDENPAITGEIASLTSYEGAGSQGWHHDVLVDDASAVRFGRTYAPSYSLFIAMQDTTADMGATRICPGSHMCGVHAGGLCDQHAFAYGLVQPKGDSSDEGNDADGATPAIWSAGDGVLFDQHICHHGERHTRGPPRIMFVVSFSRRPDWTRVLPKGLFSVGHWNVWGLTLRDLQHATHNWTVRSRFFRILRGLGIWKFPSDDWGIDFVTKSIMYWSIRENGMEVSDLLYYAVAIQETLGYPNFLQGNLTWEEHYTEHGEEDEDFFQVFIDSWLSNFRNFFFRLNVALCLTSLIFLLATTCGRSQRSLRNGATAAAGCNNWVACIVTLAAIYVFPTLFVLRHRNNVAQSDWGRNILSGLTYRKPFPQRRTYQGKLSDDNEIESDSTTGPTTFPERTDVLIGTRLHSHFLGAYANYLNYHPGNVVYNRAIRQTATYYRSYKSLFQAQVQSLVKCKIRGRMLQQDWQTGDWHVMSGAAIERRIRCDLAKSAIDQTLDATVDVLLARNRFDVLHRVSSLARAAQSYLLHFRHQILWHHWCPGHTKKRAFLVEHPSSFNISTTKGQPLGLPFRALAAVRDIRNKALQTAGGRMAASHSRWMAFPSGTHRFEIGDTMLVLNQDDRTFHRAVIWGKDVDDDGHGDPGEHYLFNIGYEDQTDELGISGEEFVRLFPLEAGSRVWCYAQDNDDEGDLEEALITRIKPDGTWDVMYLSDETEVLDINPTGHCFWEVQLV